MIQILLAYNFTKKQKKQKKSYSLNDALQKLDGNTDFFEIVVGVLQGYTLAPNPFIICLDYVIQMTTDLIKESGFTFKKKTKASDIPVKLTYADYIWSSTLLIYKVER